MLSILSRLLWFVLAGFILGFATSTLWEWYYYRGKRLAVGNQRNTVHQNTVEQNDAVHQDAVHQTVVEHTAAENQRIGELENELRLRDELITELNKKIDLDRQRAVAAATSQSVAASRERLTDVGPASVGAPTASPIRTAADLPAKSQVDTRPAATFAPSGIPDRAARAGAPTASPVGTAADLPAKSQLEATRPTQTAAEARQRIVDTARSLSPSTSSSGEDLISFRRGPARPHHSEGSRRQSVLRSTSIQRGSTDSSAREYRIDQSRRGQIAFDPSSEPFTDEDDADAPSTHVDTGQTEFDTSGEAQLRDEQQSEPQPKDAQLHERQSREAWSRQEEEDERSVETQQRAPRQRVDYPAEDRLADEPIEMKKADDEAPAEETVEPPAQEVNKTVESRTQGTGKSSRNPSKSSASGSTQVASAASTQSEKKSPSTEKTVISSQESNAKSKRKNAKAKSKVNYPDDLTLINGIGPALSKRLHSAGIFTWHQVDEAKRADLAEATKTKDSDKIDSWKRQARKLAEDNNRKGATYTGAEPANFREIRGVKHADIQHLYSAGIVTFEDLGKSKPEQLQEIFEGLAGADAKDYLKLIHRAQELQS